MDDNLNDQPEQVRLPRFDEDPYARQAAARDSGVRSVRRVSNWTAAALVAGVAATAGYFAHASHPAPAATTVTKTVPGGAATSGAAAHCPKVSHPVATSGGSGVTTGTGGATAGPSGNCVTGGSGGATSRPVVWNDD